MLTLREPMRLQALSQMVRPGMGFDERIASNYSLMAARVTAKELLHLLTAPPELYLVAGGGTTDIRQDTRNSFQVAVEMVNSFVNRVTQMDSLSYTYQDEAFLTSVLNKLGVPGASQFLQFARTQREEHLSLQQLYQLHRENERMLRQVSAQAGKTQKPGRKRKKKQKEKELPPEATPFTIHNEIYSRLQTDSIYHSVTRHQHNLSLQTAAASPGELRTAEQLWVSRLLSLRRMQQRLFAREPLLLQHQTNHYELGEIAGEAAAPSAGDAVAAAAALLSAVNSTMITKLSREYADGPVWLDLRTAISRSAENSLARYELHHLAGGFRYSDHRDYSRQVTSQYNTGIDLQNRFIHQQRQEGAGVAGSSPPAAAQQIPPPAMEVPGPAQPPETGAPGSPGEHTEHSVARYEQHHRDGSSHHHDQRDYSRHMAALYNAEASLLSRFVYDQRQYGAGQAGVFPPEPGRQLTPPAMEVPAPAEQPEPGKREEPPAERIETLREQLERIDRQNRQYHERMLEAREHTLRETRVTPDRKRTLRDALRSLENPGELPELPAEEPVALRHPAPQAQLESALEAADPQTRRIIETVLRYQSGREQPEGKAVLQTPDAAAFNEEMHRIARQETVDLVHREEEQTAEETMRREVAEQVVRQSWERAVPPLSAAARGAQPPAPVPTVHRRQQLQDPEELEGIIRRHTQEQVTRTVTTSLETAQRVTETPQAAAHMEQRDRSGEEISEIVNRTLARQINVISEKVYNQMERRLQSERARRGR